MPPPIQRFRFVPPGSPVEQVYRAFRYPRPMLALEDTVASSDPPGENELRIVSKLPPGPAPLKLKKGTASIAWQPNAAVVTASDEERADILAALVEFTYYESELRRMEKILAEGLAEAERDSEFVYQIQPKDYGQRSRVTERMTHYTKLRLSFAQLEPHLSMPSPDLSLGARRWFKKLMERADAEGRAEALGDQLELREELYEGAADRFTDYWGWAHGHKLEVIIIALLLLEFFVMITDLAIHLYELKRVVPE